MVLKLNISMINLKYLLSINNLKGSPTSEYIISKIYIYIYIYIWIQVTPDVTSQELHFFWIIDLY